MMLDVDGTMTGSARFDFSRKKSRQFAVAYALVRRTRRLDDLASTSADIALVYDGTWNSAGSFFIANPSQELPLLPSRNKVFKVRNKVRNAHLRFTHKNREGAQHAQGAQGF